MCTVITQQVEVYGVRTSLSKGEYPKTPDSVDWKKAIKAARVALASAFDKTVTTRAKIRRVYTYPPVEEQAEQVCGA